MLDRVLEDISQMLHLRAKEKQLGFAITIRDDVPNALIGDAHRLRQILINLANNAVKFTEKGGVDIQVSLLEQSEHQTMLRFEVADTGIGIPAQSMDSGSRGISGG